MLSTTPSISSPSLYDNGADKNNTACSVNSELHANHTIGDTNTLADLKNVTWLIYDDTGSTWDDSDAEVDHYTISWTESTDAYACSPSGFINEANCKDPGTGSSSTSYEFQLAFDLSKVATYRATPIWKINCTVWDDSENTNTDTTLMFGVAFYNELNIPTDTTHTWTGKNPGDINQTLTTPGDYDIDFTVIANANFDTQAKSNATNLVSGSDTIPVSNVRVHEDTLTSSAFLTTSYADVGGLTAETPPTAEASPKALSLMLWATVPGGTPPGTYGYKLQLQVVQS